MSMGEASADAGRADIGLLRGPLLTYESVRRLLLSMPMSMPRMLFVLPLTIICWMTWMQVL